MKTLDFFSNCFCILDVVTEVNEFGYQQIVQMEDLDGIVNKNVQMGITDDFAHLKVVVKNAIPWQDATKVNRIRCMFIFFSLHFSMYVSSLSLCRQLTDILSVRQTSVDSIISYIFIFSPKNLNIKFEVGILFNSVILCVRNKYDRLIFPPWITDDSHFCYWAYPSSHKYTTNSYLLTSSFQYNSPSIWKLICSCKRSHIYLSEHYL